MAGLVCYLPLIPMNTGTAKKTLWQLVAPSNHRLKIIEARFMFRATTLSAAPLCELRRQTSAGTLGAGDGTGGAITPAKYDPGLDETPQATAQKGHTAAVWGTEPTDAGDIPEFMAIPSTQGIILRPTRELFVPGGGRLGGVVTSAADIAIVPYVLYEE